MAQAAEGYIKVEDYNKLKEEFEELAAKYDKAIRDLERLRLRIFGRTSEKHLPMDPSVLEPGLFDELFSEEERKALEAEAAAAEQGKAKVITVKEHERKVRTPVIDTSKLEVRETHLYPEGINPDEYTEIGTEVTDRIAIEPARMYIDRVIRHKMVLKTRLQAESPEKPAFAIAPLPQMAIYKGMASESLLADIILNKYMYHLPFYRQIQKYKESGVTLSDSTMNDWFAAVCAKLRPLYMAVRDKVMGCSYIQVDETVEPVIDNEKHRAAKGYIWAVRSPETGEAFFYYDEGRRTAETARKLLGTYRGAVQTDGYSVYEAFEGTPGKLMLGCWAHCRRKYATILQTSDSRMGEDQKQELAREKAAAAQALAFIGNLYRVEEEIRGNKSLTAEQIVAKRQKESYPTIRNFETWAENASVRFNKGSEMYKALSYTYTRMVQLSRYVNDARYLIDNSGVENAIRPIALGRKNYLFCGNHAAVERAAIAYSLITCCKAAGVDPRKWLEDVLRRLETEDPKDLIPSVWKESHR